MNPCRVLFLCDHNSSRSLMHEAVLGHEGTGRFVAYSAGRRPAAHADPDALDALRDAGLATADLAPKSWHRFTGPGAPVFDIVIRVCGPSAEEDCPDFAGPPVCVQWPVAHPRAASGSVVARAAAYRQALARATYRVLALIRLPVATMPRDALVAALTAIGDHFADDLADDD
ncbi:arsenate reductase [Dyella jiangningensis]|uniref:arsenate reductase/protein-tyrosine-phosphatase family protein n=1 Tax=Dyella sp. AtDHG13 TaxID=1938897 RepID=UPI00088325A4|nr:hypothetical protein [Dyella sp. AtDHG13]PXV55937.1 arsenate reductase [Dyella sp. AtDHG13]SDK49987.1 arsenate reductase [Dyella jiangningensis]